VLEAWVEEPLEMKQTGDFQADVYAGMMEYIERLEGRLRADPAQWAVIEAIWDGEAEVKGERSEVRSQRSEVREEQPEVVARERGDG